MSKIRRDCAIRAYVRVGNLFAERYIGFFDHAAFIDGCLTLACLFIRGF